MEHKVKKVVKSNATRNTRWQPIWPWEKGTKTRVKEWVKDNVGRRGLDAILWGRWERCEEKDEGEEETGKTTGGESKEQEPANLQKTDEETG